MKNSNHKKTNVQIRVEEDINTTRVLKAAGAVNTKTDKPLSTGNDIGEKQVSTQNMSDINDCIAIVGMSGRFPGANNIDQFWQNLCGGEEALKTLSQEQISAALAAHDHISAPHIMKQMTSGTWVNACFYLDDTDKFDAGFFGYTPSEAELLDPQQRLFLETAWAAIEDAGYIPDEYPGVVGIFGGGGLSRYFLNNIYSNRDIMYSSRDLTAGIGNEPDYITNRVAYKLNLTGPSVSVQTACSTSLVAIHMACQSLLAGESDMCLAGGVLVTSPSGMGYLYQEGSMASPDGHIRTFDADAQGTVFSDGGVGIICLKRVEDALADNDSIYALIRGSAANNDGIHKAGYTAPGIEGQMSVINEALAVADVDPAHISYIETHGTGTPLGDPIEVTALTRAYREHTDKIQYCALGSLKPNVGHLAPAAGVAAVIKTALSLKYGVIPPTINFNNPNPRIDFDNSPFYVNDTLRTWDSPHAQRLAAVSSFGIGGTNAHIVMQELPITLTAEQTHSVTSPGHVTEENTLQSFLLSAKTSKALQETAANLQRFLQSESRSGFTESKAEALNNIAYTLRHGRKAFEYRSVLAASSKEMLCEQLQALAKAAPRTKLLPPEGKTVFMFSGQGSQYIDMGRELYQTLPVFKERLDTSFSQLNAQLDVDLHSLVFPTKDRSEKTDELNESLRQTRIAQPLLFSFEYALACQLEDFGIHADAMIGHSLGEYVAATLAGVFSLPQALQLIALRGQLMQSMPAGSMLSVAMDQADVTPLLSDEIALAASNAPNTCVLSGPTEQLAALQKTLETKEVVCRALMTSHAFHSSMMNPIADTFTQAVRDINPQVPERDYISNVTGQWITAEQAQNPAYWTQHLLGTVHFADGIRTLLEDECNYFIEVGPGNALTTFANRTIGNKNTSATAVQLVRHPKATESDALFFRSALGKLWSAGYPLDWETVEPCYGKRVSLPTYPFARDSYWLEAKKSSAADAGLLTRQKDKAQWSYVPSWKRQPLLTTPAASSEQLLNQEILLLGRQDSLSTELLNILNTAGANCTLVIPGEQFQQLDEKTYVINPVSAEDFETLFARINTRGSVAAVIHTWNFSPETELSVENWKAFIDMAFYSSLYLVQAVGSANTVEKLPLITVSSEVNDVTPFDTLNAAKATQLGVQLCMGYEFQNILGRHIDFHSQAYEADNTVQTARQILNELTLLQENNDGSVPVIPQDKFIAYRARQRWVAGYEALPLPDSLENQFSVAADGVYLITGGLGGLGLEFASYLAERGARHLALVARSTLPEKDQWKNWIEEKGEQDSVTRKLKKIQALEAAGVSVCTYAADVLNLQQMEEVITEVCAQQGPVKGVIHSAGIAGNGVMQMKTREDADKVLLPKVQGTLVLQAALGQADQQPDFFVLFSSMFSVIGGIGQVDYSAANNFMDAFARDQSARFNAGSPAHSGAAVRTLSINWGGWREVGMAVDMGMIKTLSEPAALPEEKQLVHPYLHRLADSDEDGAQYIAYLREEDHWALQEHRIQQQAVMPGTGMIEMARAAFANFQNVSAVTMSNLYFYRPLFVPTGSFVKVLITFRKTPANNFTFDCAVQPEEAGAAPVTIINGDIQANTQPSNTVSLQSLQAACNQDSLDFSAEQPQVVQSDEQFLQLGPRWQVIRKIDFGEKSLLGELELPAACQADLADFYLHPSLLDMATGPITGHLLQRAVADLEGEFLPFSYGELAIHAPLTEKIYSYVELKEISDNGDTVDFDITVFDKHGNHLLSVKHFVLKQVIAGLSSAKQSANDSADSIALDLTDSTISPREGKAVFDRIMATAEQPQWVISTQSLPVLLEKLQQENSADSSGSQKSRVQREDSDIAPPENPLQEILVSIYENVLGIEPIGIHDNFFEMGGDSVMGIQIVSQAKAHGLSIKPNQLFDHQTIAALSMVVEVPAQMTQQANTDNLPVTAFQRYRHQIQIQRAATAVSWWNITLNTPVSGVEPCRQALQAMHEFYPFMALKINTRDLDTGWEKTDVVNIDSINPVTDDNARLQETLRAAFSQGYTYHLLLMQASADTTDCILAFNPLLGFDISVVDQWVRDFTVACEAMQKIPADSTPFSIGHSVSEKQKPLQISSAVSNMNDPHTPPRSEINARGNWLWEPVTGQAHAYPPVVLSIIDDMQLSLLQEQLNVTDEDIVLSCLVAALSPCHQGSMTLLLQRSERYPQQGSDADECIVYAPYCSVNQFNTVQENQLDNLKQVKSQLRKLAEPQHRMAMSNDIEQWPAVQFIYRGGFENSSAAIDWSRANWAADCHLDHQFLSVTVYRLADQLIVQFYYDQALKGNIETIAEDMKSTLKQLVNEAKNQGGSGYTSSDFLDANLSEDDFETLLDSLND